MRLIKRLLGIKKSQPEARLFVCHVYYSAKGLAIAAVHDSRTRRWSVEGEPMVFITPGVNDREIGQAVIRSLDGSRDGLSDEQAESQWKCFPRFLGEASWQSIEATWELIALSTAPNTGVVLVHPLHRYETGGWIIQSTDPVYSCDLDPQRIGELLLKIIRGPAPTVIPHVPSHV
jgi:hypothetical protein